MTRSQPPARMLSSNAIGRIGAAAVALLVLCATAVDAQAKAGAPPDWNGVWVLAGSPLDKQDGTYAAAPGRFNPDRQRAAMEAEPVFKGVYLDRWKAAIKAAADGKPVEDTGAMCLPQGMPRFWFGPYAYEILQTGKQMNIFQEWNEQVRRVYLDGRKHPEDADLSYNGHSIGHWEGDVLVVDTSSLLARSRIGLYGYHSDAMHITERFRTVGPDLLDVEVVTEDPEALAKPWINIVHLHRRADMNIEQYICAENNRNTVGADGVTQSGLQPQ